MQADNTADVESLYEPPESLDEPPGSIDSGGYVSPAGSDRLGSLGEIKRSDGGGSDSLLF